MYQSNNYFKNGALVLVVVMLITVPNLNVYSSIGSYQVYSQAISANTNYKKKSFMSFLTTRSPLIYQVYDYDDTECLLLQNESEIAEALKNEIQQLINQLATDNNSTSEQVLSLKAKPYAKYDFSGFDN